MPTQRTCCTCGRVLGSKNGRECGPCAAYRWKHGATRPYGLDNARTYRGARHFNWRGDRVSASGWQKRVEQMFPVTGQCQLCGNAPAWCRHHWDKNPANNAPENIALLCNSCHRQIHHRGYWSVTP